MKYKFFALAMIALVLGASQILAKSGKDGRGEERREMEVEGIIDSSTPVGLDVAIGKAQKVKAGPIDRVEQEVEDGQLVWKVRVRDGDDKADVRIDAQTGEVLRAKGMAVRNGTLINATTNVTRAQAISIALNLTNATLQRIEQGHENGTLVWKVRLIGANSTRFDIDIHAATGAVLRIRQSRIVDLSSDFNPGKNGPGSSQGNGDNAGKSRGPLLRAFLRWMGLQR